MGPLIVARIRSASSGLIAVFDFLRAGVFDANVIERAEINLLLRRQPALRQLAARELQERQRVLAASGNGNVGLAAAVLGLRGSRCGSADRR